MGKSETMLQAGKQLLAVAAGRAFRGEPIKTRPEDLVNHPEAPKQGEKEAQGARSAEKEGHQDPGNPNAVDYGNQDPGQERA